MRGNRQADVPAETGQVKVVEDVGHDRVAVAAAARAVDIDPADIEAVEIVAAIGVFLLEPPRPPLVAAAGPCRETGIVAGLDARRPRHIEPAPLVLEL